MMLQETFKTIQLYARVGEKNGKPAILVSKWITDAKSVQEIVSHIREEKTILGFITVSDKVKFYGGMTSKKMIEYNFDKDKYFWNEKYLESGDSKE